MIVGVKESSAVGASRKQDGKVSLLCVSNEEIQAVSEMRQNWNVGYPFYMLKELRDDFRSFAVQSYEVNAV